MFAILKIRFFLIFVRCAVGSLDKYLPQRFVDKYPREIELGLLMAEILHHFVPLFTVHSFTRLICPGGAGLQILQPSTGWHCKGMIPEFLDVASPKWICSEISKLAHGRWWFDDVFFFAPRQQWLSSHESWWIIKQYKCCACKSIFKLFYLYTYPCRIFPKGIVVCLQTYRWKTSGCFQSEMMPKPCQLKTAWCLPWETIGWTDFHPGDPSLWTVKMVCEVNSRLHSEQGAGKQTFARFFAAKNEVILKKLIISKVFLQFESHLL